MQLLDERHYLTKSRPSMAQRGRTLRAMTSALWWHFCQPDQPTPKGRA